MYKGLKNIIVTIFILSSFHPAAQSVESRLGTAFESFENDPQLANAISSLYVQNASTGKVVFEKNGNIGLAPASTQKIITAASAYEFLGKDFRYKTELGYQGSIINNILKGDFYIKPSGDPTLGSWRWRSTSDSLLLRHFMDAISKLNLKGYRGIEIYNEGWFQESIPDGWIWQDIGNYYGAGVGGFNWRENQFDIFLASGNEIGSNVNIIETRPAIRTFRLDSYLKSAAKGTGDNAYVYYPLESDGGVIRGTIPVGEKRFSISASYPNVNKEFESIFRYVVNKGTGLNPMKYDGNPLNKTVIYTHYSPSIDSIIYWFNRKSINLYGEAIVKTIAFQNKGEGAISEGVKLIKDHWKSKGISPTELNMYDGSGLSPLNRVTTKAQVEILQYAKKQSWYNGFYNSLPEFNGIKMKSGTISGVKAFTGYHKSKEGTEYIFSFIVNNYNGSASSLVQKMYTVLNVLK
ncbi:MAG TPA: D-alanyl-D-alanine carboxypeptidase/D-alanyl-D-alanine-endopeptidase [Chitinophagaceae bacterium]